MKSQSEWIPVTKSEPCKVCGRSTWCQKSADGVVGHCMRNDEGAFKLVESGGSMHRLTERPQPQQPRRVQPKRKRLSDNELHAKWEPQVRQMLRGSGKPVERLARYLGVASWALKVLGVGYGELAGSLCWSFPEHNAILQAIGINRRLVTPVNGENKRCAPGSRRGLTYCAKWDDFHGPIHIVEGGSDVAAGLTLRLCVIGRPSNVGGIGYLVRMLGPIARRIVVFAERDRKKHENLKPVVQKRHDPKCQGCISCWPGKFGAVQTAAALHKRLGRRVEWRFLPDKAKDLRAWLNAQAVDVEDTDAAFELGRRISGE